MKSRAKTWSGKEFRRKIEQNGYHFTRREGSHFVYHNESGRCLVVTRNMNKMVARRLCKEYGLK